MTDEYEKAIERKAERAVRAMIGAGLASLLTLLAGILSWWLGIPVLWLLLKWVAIAGGAAIVWWMFACFYYKLWEGFFL